MTINIQSLHFTASKALNDLATEKVNKLSHFYDRIVSAEVCMKLENSGTTDNKVCEITLQVPGNNLFAERKCTSFEEAIAATTDALEQQIRKMKTKTENN